VNVLNQRLPGESGECAKVLEPDSLVKEIKDDLERALRS